MVSVAVRPGTHAVRLHSPHYADPADGTQLHRYLDEGFVERYMQEARSGRLTRAADQAWRSEDRFGRLRDHPHLRLPMHRTFYVASVEISCDQPGAPALDPARILSAGLVIRRQDGAGVQRWMLREGEPLGWRGGEIPDHEPDEYRRLLARRLIPPQTPEPPYSGEAVSPLHPLVVRRPGAGGRARNHTLLFGYVPLGGSHRVDATQPPEPGEDGTVDYADEHDWPFGSHGQTSWRQRHGLAVDDRAASTAFRGLLRTLIARYRVQEADEPDNTALRGLLAQLHFHSADPIEPGHGNDSGDPDLKADERREDLRSWLDREYEAVLEWDARIERGDQPAASPLPGLDGRWLYLTEDQCALLRELLVIRTEQVAAAGIDALPLPRFGQGDDEVFHARPFVRYLDDCDCERLVWGPASRPFRVAAPLDPEASRPQLIPLPELDDVRRGMAKGVSFLAPKSLADQIRRLKMDMDVGQGGPGNRLGTCWSFSFSLPAISLCAMIMLMIMINLLNLLFFWLPWVFLALPRLCLKAMVKIGS